VTYRAKPGFWDSSGDGFRHTLSYNFTGGNWKGALAQADLLLVSHIPGALLLAPSIPDEKKVTRISRQRNRLAITWKDWQAEGDFTCDFLLTYPRWLVFSGNDPAYHYAFIFDPMLAPTYTLLTPGLPPYLDWSPPAMWRGKVVYVKLTSLACYLTVQAEQARRRNQVAMSWKDGAAVLQAGTHTFRFTRRAMTMQADGKTMPLPAHVLHSVPASEGWGNGKLYVPLQPVVQALGGTMHINTAQRKISLQIPPRWMTARK
jgi:hypothetical protein